MRQIGDQFQQVPLRAKWSVLLSPSRERAVRHCLFFCECASQPYPAAPKQRICTSDLHAPGDSWLLSAPPQRRSGSAAASGRTPEAQLSLLPSVPSTITGAEVNWQMNW